MIFRMPAKVLSALLLAAVISLPVIGRAAPLATGAAAPDFTLYDPDGRKYSLAAELGKRPVVLVFYRGSW